MATESKSTGIINDSDSLPDGIHDSRENVLSRLDEVIKILHTKAISGRIKNPENEKVKIQYFRVLAYTCSIYNQINRDIEMDQLKEEIETLKTQIEALGNMPGD